MCEGCRHPLPVIALWKAERCIQDGRTFVRLQWEVFEAEHVRIQPEGLVRGPKGSLNLYDYDSDSYVLEVVNHVGSRQLAARVLTARPRIRKFSCTETRIELGFPTIFHWEAEHAERVEIFPEVGDVSGSSFAEAMLTRPGEYTLKVSNESGSVTARVSLDMAPPEIKSFYGETGELRLGAPVMLFWEVFNAERVTLTPDIGEVTGRRFLEVQPDRSIVYTLQAENAAGTVETELHLVMPAPTILYFGHETGLSTEGEPLELSWEAMNAREVILEPGGHRMGPVGKLKVKPRQAFTTYTLTAFGPSGTESCSFEVMRFPIPPDLLENVEPTQLYPDMDKPKGNVRTSLPDTDHLESDIQDLTREQLQLLRIQRAQKLELTEDLLTLERASLRSEVQRAMRKIRTLLSRNQPTDSALK